MAQSWYYIYIYICLQSQVVILWCCGPHSLLECPEHVYRYMYRCTYICAYIHVNVARVLCMYVVRFARWSNILQCLRGSDGSAASEHQCFFPVPSVWLNRSKGWSRTPVQAPARGRGDGCAGSSTTHGMTSTMSTSHPVPKWIWSCNAPHKKPNYFIHRPITYTWRPTDRHMTTDNHPPTPASHKLPLIPQAEILISKGPWSNSASPPASAHSSTISCTKCNGCQTRCRTHGLHGSPCTSCIHAKATMVDRWLATHGPSCSGKPRPWLVA